MIKNENFIVIQGFMINELKLKGNELLVYAIIYGFSQTDNQRFTGSLQYLSGWINSTKQGVIKNLKSLIEKGYITKDEKFINGVKFCEYHATKFNGVLNRVEWGIKQSLPNNIDNNIDNNKKEKKKSNFDLLIEDYTDNTDLKSTIYDFIKMRKTIKAAMTDNALKLMLKKLDGFTSNDEIKIKILEQSILNSWKGIFKLKEDNNGSSKQNTPASEDKWAKYDLD